MPYALYALIMPLYPLGDNRGTYTEGGIIYLSFI